MNSLREELNERQGWNEEAFAFWVPTPNVWTHDPTVGVAQGSEFVRAVRALGSFISLRQAYVREDVRKEFSALSQSRRSASGETRDRVHSHSETRVLAGRECITAKHQAMKRKHHQDSEPCSPSAYSSTICTLASICGVPALLEEIQYTCDVLRQVQLEAWHVANLDVVRVFSSLS